MAPLRQPRLQRGAAAQKATGGQTGNVEEGGRATSPTATAEAEGGAGEGEEQEDVWGGWGLQHSYAVAVVLQSQQLLQGHEALKVRTPALQPSTNPSRAATQCRPSSAAAQC